MRGDGVIHLNIFVAVFENTQDILKSSYQFLLSKKIIKETIVSFLNLTYFNVNLINISFYKKRFYGVVCNALIYSFLH